MLIGLALSLGVAASEADVVVVVSANSAVLTLSKEQVADIFLHKSNRFPDGSQAIPIDQPEVSKLREEFYNRGTTFFIRLPIQGRVGATPVTTLAA